MTKILKAIPTTYHGIEFRSKLEAKYAQAFDKLGIVWEYESHGFRFDDGTCYCPDFYMPEIDTYFEVKGVMDDNSRNKIRMLASEGKEIVVGDASGKINFCHFWPYDDEELRRYFKWCIEYDEEPKPYKGGFSKDCAGVAQCSECGKVYFLSWVYSWNCRACNRSGDDFSLYTEMYDNNLFKSVGWSND